MYIYIYVYRERDAHVYTYVYIVCGFCACGLAVHTPAQDSDPQPSGFLPDEEDLRI